MKITLLAPPWISLPPKGYGGIEEVVYNLSEELVRVGHDVTVFSTGDSKISARLGYLYKSHLGADRLLQKNYILFFLNHIYHSLKNIPKDTDIIHNHCEYASLHLMDAVSKPFVHTLHGAFYNGFAKDNAVSKDSVTAFQEVLNMFYYHPFVSISDQQRNGNTKLNYIQTVYNGINIRNFDFRENPKDYIAWLGRFSPVKGLDVLLKVAKENKKPTRISVSVHEQRKEEFDKKIKPLIKDSISLIPSLTDQKEKSIFLGNARVFLFPILWEEPFGLVMVEAMATGTPVVAFARGSVPEVIKDGETGLLVNPSDQDIRGNWIVKKTGVEGLIEAVEKIYQMPQKQYLSMRKSARMSVEKSFTVEKMAQEYIKVYKEVISES